jgi:hypothetical protein
VPGGCSLTHDSAARTASLGHYTYVPQVSQEFMCSAQVRWALSARSTGWGVSCNGVSQFARVANAHSMVAPLQSRAMIWLLILTLTIICVGAVVCWSLVRSCHPSLINATQPASPAASAKSARHCAGCNAVCNVALALASVQRNTTPCVESACSATPHVVFELYVYSGKRCVHSLQVEICASGKKKV